MLNKIIEEMAREMADKAWDQMEDLIDRQMNEAAKAGHRKAMKNEIAPQGTLVIKLDRLSGQVVVEGFNLNEGEVYKLLERTFQQRHEEAVRKMMGEIL